MLNKRAQATICVAHRPVALARWRSVIGPRDIGGILELIHVRLEIQTPELIDRLSSRPHGLLGCNATVLGPTAQAFLVSRAAEV